MNTTIISEPQISDQQFLGCKKLDAKVKLIGSQLENLKSLLIRVSFMVARHQYDRLTVLQKRHLYIQHNVTTCLILTGFGLYDSIEITSPYNEQRIILEVKDLEMRIIQLRNMLFTKKKSISQLL